MNKTVKCLKSKKGTLYLVSQKNGQNTLVSLVKEGKSYKPTLEENKSYEIIFTSYKLDTEKRIVTLFDVSGI